MKAEILNDKETMDAIAEYVIKEIERREMLEYKRRDKIHEDALNSCDDWYGQND